MGILNSLKPKNNTITTSEDLRRVLLADGANTASGQISDDKAHGIGAAWACINLLANSVAQLPVHLYRKDGRNKERVDGTEHPVARVLERPNALQTTFGYRQYQQAARGVYGRSYARVVRVRGGRVVRELYPIHPKHVHKETDKGRLVYRILTEDGERVTYDAAEILDIPWSEWLNEDGIPQGVGPIQKAREAFGVAMQGEKHAGMFFGNSNVPAGILSGPIGSNKEAMERVKESWSQAMGGKNKYGTAVLDREWSFTPITMNSRDAQFLESRRFSVEEVARLFGVPSSMINDNERSTFSNSEQQALNFVVYSLMPHLRAWELELSDKLLNPGERRDHFIEFNVDGLLRGDFKSRMEGYGLAITNRIMSPNEVRSKENLNAYEGGDEYRNPNIEPAQQAQPEPDA